MAANPNKLNQTHRRLAPDYLPLLYNALDEEIGLLVRTDQRHYLVCILAAAKTIAEDPELDNLIILQPADDTIFIAKKTTELEE